MASTKVKKLAKDIEKLPTAGRVLTKMAVARMNDDDALMEQAMAEGKEVLESEGYTVGDEAVDEIRIIAEMDLRVFNDKARIKILNERRDEILSTHTAFTELQKAKLEVEAANIKLRRALMSDGDYNDLMESLGAEKQTLDDDKAILSTHIVEYYAKTHEHQVEIDNTGEAREVIVNGRLGGRGKYQTNLFGPNTTVEITDKQMTITEEI